MFESVGCGERQLPADHSDLVENRLVKQRLLALAAVGRAGKLVRPHAVGGLAIEADDVQGFAHTG